MKKHILLLLCTFYSLNSLGEDNACYIQDCHGNKYRIVTIGNQIWMAENLRSFSYDTFSECYGKDLEFTYGNNWLPYYVDATDKRNWVFGNCLPKWNKSQVPYYGYFYNWYGAVGLYCENERNCDYKHFQNKEYVQGICPNGWHIPSRAEWLELIQYVEDMNGKNTAALVLKASEGWKVEKDANIGVDRYGFQVLPTGIIFEKYGDEHTRDCIYDVGGSSCFWTSSVDEYGVPYEFMFGCNRDYVEDDILYPDEGCSVRCVKD